MSSPYWLSTNTGDWEVVIGLEVHAQVASHSKLFSGAATNFNAEPNSNVALVDAAFPGMLPVLNKHCVEQAVKTGLGIHAQINKFSMFDRKNYFYPDLPQGYQISQFYYPIVGEGHLDITLDKGIIKKVRIERIHLEQDAGKSIHDLHVKNTCIDLNRSGIALMEIVTKPDMRSPEEAMAFVKALRLLLRYLGTSDGNMEEGSLRADVNVSVNRPGKPLGTRAEIKNVNSIRFIGQAIEVEALRQTKLIESGEGVLQETRLYDHNKQETRSLRSKEDAPDYRYFPDPDLLPIHLAPEYIESLRLGMPELPDAKRQRFMEEYGLPLYDATLMVDDLETTHYYENTVKETAGWKKYKDKNTAKLVSNWLTGDLFGLLNKENKTVLESPISSTHLAELVDLMQDNVISGRIAKEVFLDMWNTHKAPKSIVDEKGLVQITDTSALESMIADTLKENPKMLADYKAGKEQLFGFFVGQIMKKSAGKANPQMVNDLLKAALSQ
ncbi:MAG: Asp-tRNA(Asn)/Glu-tRNA(Gln) amidotransferase subunit GatB [Alphaproteobacteria bacterium]